MIAGDRQGLVIAGGGLAGCLAALAMAKLRPEAPLLLVEAGEAFGGNHIWSFFDSDVDPADRWLVAPMIATSWDGYDVRFPKRARTLLTGYNSCRSSLLDQAVRARLRPDQYRLGTPIAAVDRDGLTLTGGERIAAGAVIDARGADRLEALELGWQKFVGVEYRLAGPHGLARPIVMDAIVDQSEGYRFLYCLPFAPDRLLVEDTYYSLDPSLDPDALEARVRAYAEAQGWRIAHVESREQGLLPVAMGGDFDAFWPDDKGPARLGLRGGFFHPTTGYSLPDAVRLALLAARQPDLAALPAILRGEARRLWRGRGFYRLLDRMLFRAAAPARRYRVLEHFYRLDPAIIARFYAGRSSLSDKVRILSGRPPVPLGKALAQLWR
ncbi:MAG: lycopene beta-cyclase CrtY [Sphingomonadaceae bacterium]|nr:lycopene beta-cyclase CrtY [Sphingomonadaceae bacterium]